MKRFSLSTVEMAGVVGLCAVLAAVLLPWLVRGVASTPEQLCAGNLKALGLAHRLYAAEHDGRWAPRMVPYHEPYAEEAPCWSSFDGELLVPDYLTRLDVLLCPADVEFTGKLQADTVVQPVHESWQDAPAPNPVRGKSAYTATPDFSYVYWGFAVYPHDVATAEQMRAVGDVLDNVAGTGVNQRTRFDQTVTVPAPDGAAPLVLHRLENGVSRLLAAAHPDAWRAPTDADIPVIWDTVRVKESSPIVNEFNHLPAAANVLFLDGHVEWGRYERPAGSNFWMLTQAAFTDGRPSFP